MKQLALLALAAGAALIPAAASAQVVVRTPGAHVVTHPGGGFHFPRFDRHRFRSGGFAVGGFFFQPQFHVQNWQLYGFVQPGPQHHWIRYYDDALLIDRRGRVADFREGVAWDRYGERWDRDRHGIPYYAGRGGYHGDGRDYDYVDDDRYDHRDRYEDYGYDGRDRYEEHGYDRGDHERYRDRRGHGWDYSGYGDSAPPLAGCGPQPCVGYGAPGYNMQGYGYGGSAYGSAGYYMAPVVITETTITPVTTTVVTEEVTEEVVYEQRAVRRARPYRPRVARPCNCPPPRRPAPRHPPGERG